MVKEIKKIASLPKPDRKKITFGERLKNYFKNFFLRVPLQEQVVFARHLAIMAKSGMPLLDSLVMLQKQTKSRSLAKILKKVSVDVSNGQFLSASLEQFSEVFGPLFINIIRVGEASGILSENLNYLAEELKKKKEMRSKVIGAMVYPMVILVATFGITGLLTVFIFPKILPVFTSLNVKLPVTTQILIKVSNLLTNYGGYVVLIFMASVFFFVMLLKIRAIKYVYHTIILHTPIVGKLIKAVNLTNMCRTLGLTLKSGVQVVEAINITADSLSSMVYQKEIRAIAVELTRGEAIAVHLMKYPSLFPPMVAQMVMVGETTGNLSETFLYLSEFYEGEVNDFTKNLSNVLEPLLMVVMGVIVGFVALSIITPIYQVTQTLQQ